MKSIDEILEKFSRIKLDMNLYHHDDQIEIQKQNYVLLSEIVDLDKYPLFKLLCWTIPFKNSLPHMFTLMRYAEQSEKCIFEIGTCHGASAIAMGMGARMYGMNSPKLVTIDIVQPENEAHGYFKLFEDFLPVDKHIVESDSKLYDSNESIDLLYVDGSHEFDDVYEDCTKYIPLVVEGGICIFHDTGDNDVAKGIEKFLKESKDKLKFELLKEYPVNSMQQFLYNNVGITAIRIQENLL